MSNISHQIHNKLVTNFFADQSVAIDFLKKQLPAHIVKKLDFSTLKATSETAVEEKWKALHNDIVFYCKTKDNQDTYIYMLIEHQSTPDPFMPVRVLRYKIGVLGKYLDAKKKPKKLPNIISLVIYHGPKKYPYAKDIFSCFENEALAKLDITEPMILLDLNEVPEQDIIKQGGADTVLKLLLKWGRERDFIKKLASCMEENARIFLSLSSKQVSLAYEYAVHVGKGTSENAHTMKTAIQKIFTPPKAKKIFTLANYYEAQGKKEGMEKGKREGIQQGIQKAIDTINKLSDLGQLTKNQIEKALKAA